MQRGRPKSKPVRHRWLRAIGYGLLLILLTTGLLTGWAVWVEPGFLTVSRYIVTDPQLPASWDGRIIAFFSDAHVGAAYDADRLARAVTAMQTADPDLVLFGGDLVDSETPLDDPDFEQAITEQLARFDAPLGHYAVVGNHDTRLRAELNLAKRMLKNAGFKVLINQSTVIDGLWLGGLDDSYFGQPDVAGTFAKARPAVFRLLLMHEPDYLSAYPDTPVNLVLSGHSHNGQITLFGRPVFTNYQGTAFPFGYYAPGPDGRQLIVSRGLGTVMIHARLFAPPEVVIITLRRG